MMRYILIAILSAFVSAAALGEELSDRDIRLIVELTKTILHGDVVSFEEIDHRDSSGQPLPYRNMKVVARLSDGSHYSFRASKIDDEWELDNEAIGWLFNEGPQASLFKDMDNLSDSTEPLAERFHSRFNAGNFGAIYYSADSILEENVDLRAMRDKYGAHISSRKTGGCAWNSGGKAGAWQTYVSRFQKAGLIERFYVNRDDNGKPRIYDYKYMVEPMPDMPPREVSPEETLARIDLSIC